MLGHEESLVPAFHGGKSRPGCRLVVRLAVSVASWLAGFVYAVVLCSCDVYVYATLSSLRF